MSNDRDDEDDRPEGEFPQAFADLRGLLDNIRPPPATLNDILAGKSDGGQDCDCASCSWVRNLNKRLDQFVADTPPLPDGTKAGPTILGASDDVRRLRFAVRALLPALARRMMVMGEDPWVVVWAFMLAVDKAADLVKAANAQANGPAGTGKSPTSVHIPGYVGHLHVRHHDVALFLHRATPDTVLALLDHIEALHRALRECARPEREREREQAFAWSERRIALPVAADPVTLTEASRFRDDGTPAWTKPEMKLTKGLRKMLERIHRATDTKSGGLLELTILAAGGGEPRKLNWLYAAGWAEQFDFTLPRGPAPGVLITEAGRKALDPYPPSPGPRTERRA